MGMPCFEVYQVTPQGKKGDVAARGDMRSVSAFVRDFNLIAHHDPRDPFGVYYTRRIGAPMYRVTFRMDI
jgi:hypothetical protein